MIIELCFSIGLGYNTLIILKTDIRKPSFHLPNYNTPPRLSGSFVNVKFGEKLLKLTARQANRYTNKIIL